MNRTATRSTIPVKTLQDYLAVVRRRRGLALGVFTCGLVMTVLVTLLWPPIYRSSATILIEQQEIPPDLVRSTVSSYADQRIQVITQRVMTRSNLVEIIRKYDLYAKERRTDPMEAVVDRMRRDIVMRPLSADVIDPRSGVPRQATIAFTLSYDSLSPQVAQKVANELTSLYLNENLSNRREVASQASNFLNDEAERVGAQISELERQLSDFKHQNVERMPELTQFNMQLADRTGSELMEVEQNLRSIRERRIYLEAQLAQVNPRGAMYADSGERVLGPEERLKTLRAQYISQAAIYAPDHPDLVRMRKEIASLEAEVGTRGGSSAKELDTSLAGARADLAEARKRYGEGHPNVQRLERQVAALQEALAKQPAKPKATVNSEADNPAYIQLQAQLQAADADLNSLLKRQAELKDKMEGLERRLTMAPSIDQKYRELTREYDNAWARYKELKAKQTEANLAQSLESERKGERFTLIEPPQLPEQPAKPNRLLLFALGLLLSLALSGMAVAVREAMDQSIHDAQAVLALAPTPLLVKIPYIQTLYELRRRRWRRAGYAVATVAVVAVGISVVHFGYMPLDVLWFSAERHFAGL